MAAKFDAYVDPAGWLWVRVGGDKAPYEDLTPAEAREFARVLTERAAFADDEGRSQEN